MRVKNLAILSVHTSPLAPMGGKKTGGMNVYIRELAYELGQRGINVDIFVRRSSPDEPKIDYGLGDNVRVVYLDAGPARLLSTDDIYPYLSEFTSRLIKFSTIHNMHYDIVYSNYWLSGWVAAKLQEAWGTPFVQMFHTLGQMKKRIKTNDMILPDQRISTETQIIQWANRIVAATPAEHSQLVWLYRAKRRKIEIIPPGVNTSRFQPLSQSESRQHLGFDLNKHILLFVGRIEPLKSIDTIIKSLDVMKQQNPHALDNLQFALVGGDPQDTFDVEMMRLQKLTRNLGLEDVVLFLGAKDQNELPHYYASATAVIMPSDYESFGMVALEAMAMGTPVIASKVGGLAFLIRDNETGFHIPVREPSVLAERITTLIADDDRTKKMGQKASHLAQGYDWSKIADRIIEVFDDVLDQRHVQTA